MSVLETPRIYFKGEISWDPIVTNNSPSNYDENIGESILPQAANKVKAFREQAIAQVTTGGNWNPHGTHRVGFFDTAVNGFDIGNGVEAHDPMLSVDAEGRSRMGVNFLGMLVDLEPYGGISSQLFFDGMKFGVEGGYCISAPRTSRVTARYINFKRNTSNRMIAGVASVVWQTSFAKAGGLHINALDSPALQALARAVDDEDVLGLTVRFNTYRTVYFDDPSLRNGSQATAAAAQALQDKLNGGGFQPNPARSLIVGVVGLWRKGEPAHEPGDRALIYNIPTFASAHARIDDKTVTLDLANSIQEVDPDLTKANLGVLSIGTVDGQGAFTELGSFDYHRYDKAAYEATAGIVTVRLEADKAKDAADRDLQLRDASGNVILSEIPLRAIPSTPNLYLDEGENAVTTFQVYERGVPVKRAVGLVMYQFDAAGNLRDNGAHPTTDDHGVLTIPIRGTAGGLTTYVPSFSSADQPGSNGMDPQVNTYLFARTRPADADVAALPATWENVYARVLANWHAMAPCMDNWLRLDDPVQVKAYAAIIKRLTNPANFESYRFMPVTRDMSAGERTLLYRFLDGPTEAEQPPVVSSASEVATEAPASSKQLSRAMRGTV